MSKKYKIGINACFTPSGGSLTQIINMVHYLSDMKYIELVIYSKKKNNSIFKNINLRNHKITLSWLSNTSALGRVIWEQLFLPFYVARDGIDVLFCPGNISPIYSPIKKVQWIGTIGPFWEKIYSYPIGILKRIKYPLNKLLMYKSAEKADCVIFESYYTQKYFLNRFNISKDRTTVINIGKDEYFTSIPNNIESNYRDQQPFALCVSHLYSYKNIPHMIEAFSMAKRNTESDYRLLIAGGKRSNKYYNEITNIINKLKLKNSVILLGEVSKEDLRYLYSSCEFLIFPSPCENFAYTLVEAMCCGAVIICSNTTAMPETCKDAALYFDPYDTEEMSEQISQFLNNEKLRNTYRDKSIARANELPDFEDVTLQTLSIMRDLVNE